MSDEVKNPYGDMHLSADQDEMLRKEQKYLDASPEQRAAMEKELYNFTGEVGESRARFIKDTSETQSNSLPLFYSRQKQKEYEEDHNLETMSSERAMVHGRPLDNVNNKGRDLLRMLGCWVGAQKYEFGTNPTYFEKPMEFRPHLCDGLNSPIVEETAKDNTIERSINIIEGFFDNPDTYKHLNTLKNALSGAEKNKGKAQNYFCELSIERTEAGNKALAGLYDSFTKKHGRKIISPAIYSSPLTRILTPSLAYESESFLDKRAYFTDSMISHYAFPRYYHYDLYKDKPTNKMEVSVVARPPRNEGYRYDEVTASYGSDFHNVMSNMFVRMAERFGMFDAETKEDRDAIKENAVRWQKYVFAGRAYEVLSKSEKRTESLRWQENGVRWRQFGNDEFEFEFTISAEDKEFLEKYCREHKDSGFEAEKELSKKLLQELSKPDLEVANNSRNSIMGMGYQLRDEQDRPAERQYAEQFHEAMTSDEATQKDREWAKKIDITDNFDSMLYGRYM